MTAKTLWRFLVFGGRITGCGGTMAYLSPTYDYDVFVSYSHGDPKGAGGSPLKTWSHALIEALIADIRSLSPEFVNFDIWYDRELDPTLNLTPELRGKVKSAAVLMIMMSHWYLKSVWCHEEREWFEEQVEGHTSDGGRVFVIRVQFTEEGDWPDFLRDERGWASPGFRFHPPPEQPGDIVEPFGWPDLIERNEPFRRELAKLRTVLTRRLRHLKSSVDTGAVSKVDETEVTAERPSRIYLHTRPEHEHLRARIDRELHERNGCTIVSPPPVSAGGDAGLWVGERKARIAAARFCDALALLRPTADGAFVGDLLDVGVDERERIRLQRGAPLPCAVLDGSGAPLEVDTAGFRIERFDLGDPQWPMAFLDWVGRNRAALPAVSP